MGFKSFLNNFVEITPSNNNTNESANKSIPQVSSIPNTGIPSGYYDNSPIPQISVDSISPSVKMMDNFRNVLNESNLPGPDLKEFIDSISEITDLPDDKKYTMVYKILSKNGLSMDKIEKSYSIYLEAIKNNQSGFEELIASANKNISDKESRLPAIDSEIVKLQEAIAKLQIEKTTITSSIVEEKSNLSAKTIDYNLAKEHWLQLLTNTYNKIKQYNN